MQELVVTRGLPGSGKTHYAHAWIAEQPDSRARVNRDELRSNLFPAGGPVLHFKEENVITKVQQDAVTTLLRSGRSVIVDDTHLRAKYINPWLKLATKWGVEFRLQDFTDVPLETCIERDAQRAQNGGRFVGPTVITEMAGRLKQMPPVLVELLEITESNGSAADWVYEPDIKLPIAWVFDIDGTLALNTGGRSPYDWTRVGEDSVNEPVKEALTRKFEYGDDIILVSGRDESCRDETEQWLVANKIKYHELFMRPEGDNRNDAVVKLEIFREHIDGRYCVLGIYDDRDRVVEMWRSVGLLCCQVAPGDF